MPTAQMRTPEELSNAIEVVEGLAAESLVRNDFSHFAEQLFVIAALLWCSGRDDPRSKIFNELIGRATARSDQLRAAIRDTGSRQ